MKEVQFIRYEKFGVLELTYVLILLTLFLSLLICFFFLNFVHALRFCVIWYGLTLLNIQC